ncbi:MAG: lipoyl synthase [Magnetococcales bacterium]|nr:lipoyl synthase [Magnetococcales bacterium]
MAMGGKPVWLKVRPPASPEFLALQRRFRQHRLHTVCEEALCPNRDRCWSDGEAAFMILGTICTRRCAFCNVQTGRPRPPDDDEPQRLADTVRELGLRHVVVTSVDRDDLPDGGAGQFVASIQAIRATTPGVTIEVLIPDFRDKPMALDAVLAAAPEVLNHNIETVPRLYPTVRPAANYHYSLRLLQQAAAHPSPRPIMVKSGLMVGLGESWDELLAVLHDLHRVGVTRLTIGQYLRPSPQHHPVDRYWPPEWFDQLHDQAIKMGFQRAAIHPLVRSSLQAQQLLDPSAAPQSE